MASRRMFLFMIVLLDAEFMVLPVQTPLAAEG
jgi:hypothetical protein